MDKNFYKDISIFPAKKGKKEQRHKLWNFKRYKLSDIQPGDNISLHTGTEAFPDMFTAVVDLDYDIRRYWPLLQPIVSSLFSDTVTPRLARTLPYTAPGPQQNHNYPKRAYRAKRHRRRRHTGCYYAAAFHSVAAIQSNTPLQRAVYRFQACKQNKRSRTKP
mgnify:CR=1 FL=1